MGEEPAAQLDSLDYGETLTAVARLAVPDYADWCFVELQMPDGELPAVRDDVAVLALGAAPNDVPSAT